MGVRWVEPDPNRKNHPSLTKELISVMRYDVLKALFNGLSKAGYVTGFRLGRWWGQP